MDSAEFESTVSTLVACGLIRVPIGEVKWGDLAGCEPFCANYGFSRGDPVDRRYLGLFLRRINPLIAGRVLEIGGRNENIDTYGLQFAERYTAMDIDPTAIGIVRGDAHDADCWEAESFETILAFNVLEHCARPWDVIANIHRWLVPDGRFFGLVPATQRVHRDPFDHWRILPDAFSRMCGSFARVNVSTHGNLKACIAALSGIAAEELSGEELNFVDPMYPVVVCVEAFKA